MLRRVDIARVVYGLVADEIGRARKRSVEIESVAQWRDALTIDEDGVGVDSLERLDLVARVNQFFHLHEVGSEDYLLVQRTLGDWTDIVADTLRRRFEHVTFQTSGSTAAPKAVPHAVPRLVAEIDAFREIVGPRRRILLWTPPQHIYGFLFGALYAARADLDLVDLRAAAPDALRRSEPGDLLVATPHRLNAAFRTGARAAEDVTALSSSAPTPAEVWSAAPAQGLARLIEIYGSTETAGVGWRETLGDPFALLPTWTRDASDPSALRPAGRDGASIAAPDHLDWVDDRAFRPTGRRDAVVQVAGVNVCVATTQNAILASGLVSDCAVRFDADLGRLKAFVAPLSASDAPETIDRLRDAIADALPAPARPAAWSFGPELPRTAAGKLQDWPL